MVLLEEVTAALRQQELALVPNTLGSGALWMTFRPPVAHGLGSEIKGDPSGVRAPVFLQVREEMVRDDILLHVPNRRQHLLCPPTTAFMYVMYA